MTAVRLALCAALTLVLATGCSKKSRTTQPTSNSGTADALVQQANAAFGTVVAQLINGPDPSQPGDIDFRTPYGLYQQALAADPNNQQARFGVSVCGILALTTDAQVNSAFTEWSNYLNAHVPFEVPVTPAPLGVPLRLGRARDVLRLPIENFVLSEIAVARPRLAGGDPQIGTVQGIFENTVIPQLNLAVSNLGMVAADPTFQFIVTPQMQGDPGADPIEIDVTDVRALRAGCELLTSMLDVATAWNLGFATYDSVGLVNAFTPGSGWLALRSNGVAHLDHARTSLLGAIGDGEGTIQSLRAEVDPQDDDLIKLDPDFTNANAESLLTYLGHARTAINSGFSITADWDQNGVTPDVALEIHPGALFSNPIPDWKQLFPGYTAGAVRRQAFTRYQNGAGTLPIDLDIATAAYYSGYVSVSAYGAGPPNQYLSGDALITSPLAPLMHDRFKAVSAGPLWAGSYSGYATYFGYLSAGQHHIDVPYYESYDVAAAFVYVPTITWNAANYAAWTWPDPTLHGLLPQVSTTSQLLGTFGYDPSAWQKMVVLDWAGSSPPMALGGARR